MSKSEHIKYLADVRCDVSQHHDWRRRLFDNPDNTKFQISADSVRDIFPNLAEKIRSKNLRFTVEKENGDSVDAVLFKFYPSSFPSLVKTSFNNPRSR